MDLAHETQSLQSQSDAACVSFDMGSFDSAQRVLSFRFDCHVVYARHLLDLSGILIVHRHHSSFHQLPSVHISYNGHCRIFKYSLLLPAMSEQRMSKLFAEFELLKLSNLFQVRKLSFYSHRLNNGISSNAFSASVERFSTQIFHQTIKFSPCFLFEINFRNLVSVSEICNHEFFLADILFFRSQQSSQAMK